METSHGHDEAHHGLDQLEDIRVSGGTWGVLLHTITLIMRRTGSTLLDELSSNMRIMNLLLDSSNKLLADGFQTS